MKHFVVILFLIPVFCFSQDAKTLVVHGDTLWFKNITQNDSLQLTKTGSSAQTLLNKTMGTGSVWNGTAIADAYISSAVTWNAKQNALSGTGFIKISGTSISYDNSTYLTTANGVSNTITVNGHALSGNITVTASDVSLGNVSDNAQLTIANNLSDLNSASTARANLGATTVGNNIFTLTNPSAVRYIKINADNTITARTAAEMLSDIGGQASGSYALQSITVNGHALSANVTVTASDISLGNVNNTSDASKPVSTAQQTALDLKANLASPTFSGTVVLPNSTVTNAMLAGSITYSKLVLTGAILNADLAGSIAYGKLTLTGAILNADLAGSIAASKLVGSDITIVGTIATGTWQATVISSTYGGTGINNAGRTLTISTNSGTINFSGASKTLTVPLDASVSGTNTGDQTTVSGNAGTATILATGRTIAITGDLTWTSPSFDGSGNVTAAGTLASVASAGTTGSSTAIPVITINAKGLTTTITTAAVVAPAGTLSGTTLNSTVVTSSLTAIGAVTTGAGTTAVAPLNLNSASVLRTTSAAADVEYDAKNLYFTGESTMGRGYVPAYQRFRLTSNGSTISSIANFFGATSNPTLVSGAEYIVEVDLYYTNTTAGTVTWTFTNSAAPTSQNIHARFSPVAGIVAPAGSAAATYLEGDIQGDATAAKALTTSGTLTDATTQYAHFSIHLYNNTGTSLKIQATKLVGGTITPLKGSYWTCTRVPSGNTGIFVN